MDNSDKTDPAIKAQGLTKKFGSLTAVDRVDFEVKSGELFGFLGPNGAGKTTTIKMLTGLARPDAGTIKIGGIDCTKNPKIAQHLIGIVPDESNLYPELTGFENLCFCASIYGMRKKERILKANELLELFGLKTAANRKFGAYSKGMKRKLTIAAGIIHDPEILFLDEPTTGIDVSSARQLRQVINNLHKKGTTVFLTTHYIEEAERLCDRIAFIVNGKIVKIDTVSNLIQPIQNIHSIQIQCSPKITSLNSALFDQFSYKKVKFLDNSVLRVEDINTIPVGPLIRFLEEHGIEVFEAIRIKPSLEEVFVEITGIEINAMKKDKEKNGGGK
ncbi:MAG: ABC transporter ATP-binding protein [Desulforegulaceae bacterium]|nr:ABC transporter ATP-binding protein [Desulforegulaceae bacterium]